MKKGRIIKVAGPLVVAKGLEGVKMYEVVLAGEQGLLGEVIQIKSGMVFIQVYEETEGVGPGDPVVPTGAPLSVELGPGLIGAIFDGVQRPLSVINLRHGPFIVRGVKEKALPRDKEWEFEPLVKEGDEVVEGDVLGTVKETEIIVHKILVPPGVSGKVEKVFSGKKKIEDTVIVLKTEDGKKEISMLTKWSVRIPRPVKKKLPPDIPLVTGQRVIDTFFPIAKGGTACIPGPFGSGKTVTQHQLSKWADAEIVVYVGCGERGNEMTEVLIEFPELRDPRTGRPLMERTILIANTSNMPVAAREASVFTGITLAEYFRDMGYNVALMADSTSRWAEAMREISGRLEEMPGEEGYPAYLASRIAQFYERAGRVVNLGKDDRISSLSVIGAVSPPGGDLSDPVVQSTLRVVKVFWGLDDTLASRRHFPAINWLTSYSLYTKDLDPHYEEKVDKEFPPLREKAMELLEREAELEEIVRLVGIDALSAKDRLVLEGAKSIREDFLHQNAYHEVDTYSSLKKQYLMLKLILFFYDKSVEALQKGVELDSIIELPVRVDIARAKYIPEEEMDERFDKLIEKVEESFRSLTEEKEVVNG
ncbi:MAG: V-type ATP synthase subunit A [Caldiserica bacterium]|nr:MAG: V-type ATP synthase subunit A [Caldisericota bacterium]